MARSRWFIAIAITAVTIICIPSVIINRATVKVRYSAMDNNWLRAVPRQQVGLVMGAGVLPDGKPSQYLKWRVATAVELYKHGAVHTLLMSGNRKNASYNEPLVMGQYAQHLGVPAKDIIYDYAGFTTYDSCYRARYIYRLQQVTIISQGYHIPRSVALCQSLGLHSIGIAAQHTGRDVTVWYIARELLSSDKAIIEMVIKPRPAVLGTPQPIK